jgi:hypothetical protein
MRERPRSRLWRVTVLVALSGLVSLAAPSTAAFAASPRSAEGGSGDCRLAAYPPTDYFGIIIPMGEVRCASAQTRIHIEVTLERDGSPVAFATRDCRKATTCILSVDASHNDIPGSQLWCTAATGRIKSQDLAQATACENQDF